MTNRLGDQQRAYLADNMNKVSRSFSIVAPEVDAPLDDYLATAYLICRVVDNIEDTELSFAWKQARYREFTSLLDDPRVAEVVLDAWDSEAWPGLTTGEREMMSSEQGNTLWEIYGQIPDLFRSPIRHWAGVMAFGMERSGDPDGADYFISHDGVRLPARAADYDLYCFYVAGTVGRMITELAVRFYDIDQQTAEVMREGSDACGRALQKTNIVKDFARDLQRDVCFLPDEWLRQVDYTPLSLSGVPEFWKKGVLLDVLAELEKSVNYVVALPQTAVGYRRAGLLMMLPAYETILLAANRLDSLFTPDHAVKISRPRMAQCVLRARKIASDDDAIRAYSAEMYQQIRAQLGQLTAPA